MDTIKTLNHELMIRNVMNMPKDLLDFTVYGVSIAEVASIFSNNKETNTMIATIGGNQYTFSGYTNLEMVRQREGGGIEIGLTKRGA